jgi:NRPS condensation-like uncharacterized protein
MNPIPRSDILRSLDSFEEHFWLMEKVTARAHALIARIRGTASKKQWRDTCNKVQERHPSLNVSIGKNAGERPFFYRVTDRHLPLEFLDLTETTSLESFAEAELLRSFGAGDGPLSRITIFRGREQSAVVLCSHHAVVDGRAHLSILREILTVLAGGELDSDPRVFPLSTSELLGRPTPPYQGRSELNEGDPSPSALHAMPPIRILRYLLPKPDLDIIKAACRARSVSFHSALLVALAKASLRSSEYGSSNGIRALSPVDIRSKVNSEGAVGMLFVLHRVVINDVPSFWEDVARVSKSLKPTGLNEAARAFYTLAEYLVAEEHSPMSHIAGFGGTEFVHDLMVTNYGVLDWRGERAYSIEDIFTAGIAGNLDTQKVSALTFDGNLHLTLVAQNPISNLLQTSTEELLSASKGQSQP